MWGIMKIKKKNKQQDNLLITLGLTQYSLHRKEEEEAAANISKEKKKEKKTNKYTSNLWTMYYFLQG